MEGVETVDQGGGGQGWTEAVASAAAALGANTYTDRMKETVLPADIPVYLLGEVRAGGSIGAPAKGSPNKIFVISNQSEEKRTSGLQGGASFMLWITGVLGVVALALFFFAWRKGAG